MEQRISIERLEQAINLFGSFDENIRLIESEFHVTVANREGELRVNGEPEDTMLACKALSALLTLSNRGEAINEHKTWGNKFEKILAAADYKPTWYTGPGSYGMFLYGSGMGSFYNSFAENISNSLISETTMSAPGTSSGFGGGGFSGGGGGGGGGSGW